MDLATKFAAAHSYDDFLTKYATDEQARRWQASADAVRLNDRQRQMFGEMNRTMHVLCMAGAWCGDCVEQCPIFRRFELQSSAIRLRFVDRDADSELRQAWMICGAPRVPQTLIMNEDFEPLAWGGDRTLAKYRHLATHQLGAACPTGLVIDQELSVAVTDEWSFTFERAHLIARLSPRLRTRHGD